MTHIGKRFTRPHWPARLAAVLMCAGLLGWAPAAWTGETLVWRSDQNRVDADIRAWDVQTLLEEIAHATGWQVFIEPETKYTVSTKFKDLPPGDALRMLLPTLTAVLLPPQTNGPARLLVYRTSAQEATQWVRPVAPKKEDPTAKPIPNELVVTLKPGAKIDELAKKLGAKVLGRADGLNAYRLSFDSAEAAQTARDQLRENSEVASVDSNYWMHGPETPDALALSSGSPFNLRPRAGSDGKNSIVGLIDTPVQPTGGPMDAFLLPSLSVAGDARPAADQPTHGTSMFETILRGVSVKEQQDTPVKILPVDVYGNNPATTTFDVANGITAAINKGASIINLSLGSSGDSTFLQEVIKSGSQNGVLFLAAAGNDPSTAPTYPAAYPGVIAVTASGRDGNIAPYANRGDFVDVAAPGSSVVDFGGKSWLILGTSASTAYASGLAASLGNNGKMTPAQVTAAMETILPVKK
jgi:hypothetical protein